MDLAIPAKNVTPNQVTTTSALAITRLLGEIPQSRLERKIEPGPYSKLDNPQTLNLYAYVGDNPLSRIDPTGHYVCSGSKEQCAQIQDGLNLAKTATNKLGADSKEGKAIGAVLKSYGAAGEKIERVFPLGISPRNAWRATAGANGSVNIKSDLR